MAGLLDVQHPRRPWVKRSDFWRLVLTLLATLVAGPGWLARLQAEQRTFLRVHEAVLAAEQALARPVLSGRYG